MPNNVQNILIVSGDSDSIASFLKACQGTCASYSKDDDVCTQHHTFTFNSLVPVPDNVLAKGFSDMGFGWQTKNWGTKWDCHNVGEWENNSSKTESSIRFTTAWNYPSRWLDVVAAKFDTLTFTCHWCDEELPISGTAVWTNGLQDSDCSREEGVKAWAFLLKHFPDEVDRADEFGDNWEGQEDYMKAIEFHKQKNKRQKLE